MNIHCPVCDYELDFKPLRDEICPSCMIHFGYDDLTKDNDNEYLYALYSEWRKAWMKNDKQKLSNNQIDEVRKSATEIIA